MYRTVLISLAVAAFAFPGQAQERPASVDVVEKIEAVVDVETPEVPDVAVEAKRQDLRDAPVQTSSLNFRPSFTVGFDYSEGDFGADDDTRTLAVPVASTTDGLGTGEFDGGGAIDVAYDFGRFTPFVTAGSRCRCAVDL